VSSKVSAADHLTKAQKLLRHQSLQPCRWLLALVAVPPTPQPLTHTQLLVSVHTLLRLLMVCKLETAMRGSTPACIHKGNTRHMHHSTMITCPSYITISCDPLCTASCAACPSLSQQRHFRKGSPQRSCAPCVCLLCRLLKVCCGRGY
jgi:hypothetical protein